MEELAQKMRDCKQEEKRLAEMMGQLTGNEYDMQAINMWRNYLSGNAGNGISEKDCKNPAEAIQKLADLEEQKIIWLKRLKQAMLEKMFV